jgi:hypothetical protein
MGGRLANFRDDRFGMIEMQHERRERNYCSIYHPPRHDGDCRNVSTSVSSYFYPLLLHSYHADHRPTNASLRQAAQICCGETHSLAP